MHSTQTYSSKQKRPQKVRRNPSENDYYRESPSADAMTDGGGAGEGDDLASSSIEEVPR